MLMLMMIQSRHDALLRFTHKTRVTSLMIPVTSFTSSPSRLLLATTEASQQRRNEHIHSAATVYAATATPFCSQLVGVFPATLYRYWASTVGWSVTRATVVVLTDGVAAAEGEDHRLNSKSHRKEVLWPRVRLFQVHCLCPRARRKVGSELDVDGKTARGDHEANRPVQKAHTDRTGPSKYAGRCGPLAWQDNAGSSATHGWRTLQYQSSDSG